MLKLLTEKLFLSKLEDLFEERDTASLIKEHGLYKASLKLINELSRKIVDNDL